MEEFCRFDTRLLVSLLICCLCMLNIQFCSSVNDEGLILLKVTRKLLQERGTPFINIPVEPPAPDFEIEPIPRPTLPSPPLSPPPLPSPPPEILEPFTPPSGILEPSTPPLPSPPSGKLEPPPSPNTTTTDNVPPSTNSTPAARSRSSYLNIILPLAIGGPLLVLVVVGVIFVCKSGKLSAVKPWATGLSGQLQRSFVTGVPKLKRAELVAACEDFSNVIGSLSVCTLYKGTLSSGVEIAVASISVASGKDWSTSLESQYRRKIDTLSKVNHKNFVSLIGYCAEEEPFTRIMVFEYAPNGTLFEHLHIRESEHLDWSMRLRIAMGMAYCLEYMHELSPSLAHRNLTSSAIYLTEDYAAKISDFIFWDDNSTSQNERNLQSNVYSFGVVLFEMITGKLPYSAGTDSLEDWASEYLVGDRPFREMADPTLQTYSEDQLQHIGVLIRWCVNSNPIQRPSMKEVCARLREITGIEPDGAMPRLSPLWWAELEILSTTSS